jgi:hypothetical protein
MVARLLDLVIQRSDVVNLRLPAQAALVKQQNRDVVTRHILAHRGKIHDVMVGTPKPAV